MMFKTLAGAALLAIGLQAQAADVGFVPASKVATMNEVFTLTVHGSSFADNLDGGGLNLSFDPSVIHVVNVFIDGTAWDFLPDKGVTDNVAGTVTGSSFNQFSHPKIGAFDLLQYQFQAVGKGSSALHLTEFASNPFASGGSAVAVSFTDGNVTVVPEPSTLVLMTAGLITAVGLVRRRRKQT
jgi:hypothetical protein